MRFILENCSGKRSNTSVYCCDWMRRSAPPSYNSEYPAALRSAQIGSLWSPTSGTRGTLSEIAIYCSRTLVIIEFNMHSFKKRKKKLLIIAGAGSSIPFDMPSTGDINTLLSTYFQDCYRTDDSRSVDVYSYLREVTNNLSNSNYEDILYDINLLGLISNPLNTLSSLINLPLSPNIRDVIFENVIPMNHDLFTTVVKMANDKILEEFRARCLRLNRNTDIFNNLKKFINGLRYRYEVGIINLNYDDILSTACPYMFNGFNDVGEFKPQEVIYKDKWNFNYNIHGSVHYDMAGDENSIHSIKWVSDLNSDFNGNSLGRNCQVTKEGMSHPTSAIITGYDKPNQLFRYPFSIFYSILDRLVYEADKYMFIGYGFNDYHLNKSFNRVSLGKNKSIFIITLTEDKIQNPMKFRNDPWAKQVEEIFLADKHNFISNKVGEKSCYTIGKLRPNYIEHHKDKLFSIWHHGILSACENKDQIYKYL